MKRLSVLCLSASLQIACATSLAGVDVPSASPFRSADVEQQGSTFRLTWDAPDARAVTIYAVEDAAAPQHGQKVAHGEGRGSVVVSGLPRRLRWYFDLVADNGRSVRLTDRSLHLSSASNFRDAGGYRTEDGRWVRMGLVYRSNGLGSLSSADYETLKQLQLHLVCDLRMPQEREISPDPDIPASRSLQADVFADSGHRASALHSIVDSHDRTALIAFMKGAYRDFVDLPSAQASYHRLLERLADRDNLPTVFHCTAGKDRSGWAQAILLSALGVPRKTIVADYVLTNRYMTADALEQIRKVAPEIDPKAAMALVAADPAYIETSFDEVNERYGSFQTYLRRGLNISDSTIEALRASLLAD
jgi:protein-tyrosine phosphatase